MIQITLITTSPLHLAGAFSVGPLGETLPIIPGRSVRGALAELHSPTDAEFAPRFLDPRNWFGPLLPLGSEKEPFLEAWVLPSTARTCKLRKGFKESSKGHGVRDVLFDLLREDGPRQSAEFCQDEACGAKLVPYGGYYGERNGRKARIDPDMRLITRTAIDSRRETAAAGQLYSRQVIGEGHCFSGFLSIADKGQEAALAALMQPGSKLRLGGGRSRGFGEMKIERVKTQVADEWLPRDSLETRLTDFNRRARAAGVNRPEQTIFAITLRSDAVLVDPYHRPATSLSPDYLGRYLDERLASATRLGSFVDTRILDGWNNAHRLPRDSTPVFTAGSTFAFAIDMPAGDLAPLLAPIESFGIGELRQEGFGRVIINHPFHLEKDMI